MSQTAKKKKPMSTTDLLYNFLCGVFFTLFALICIFPFYYLFICTISDPNLVEVASFCAPVDEWTQLTLDALRDVMVTGSWKMVYAETDEEFDAIWDQMMKDCTDLGAGDIISTRLEDLAKAKEIKDSLSAD